jgi:hypothetical protein
MPGCHTRHEAPWSARGGVLEQYVVHGDQHGLPKVAHSQTWSSGFPASRREGNLDRRRRNAS